MFFFYLDAPTTLPTETEPPRPSKYEAKSAHIGEGLGLFVFDVWIAAYESSTYFRNVSPVTSSHPRRRNRQQPCCGNIFSRSVIETRELPCPVFMLVSVLDEVHFGYPCNTEVFYNNTIIIIIIIIMCMSWFHPSNNNRIISLCFMWILLMTYFTRNKDKQGIWNAFILQFLSTHIVL